MAVGDDATAAGFALVPGTGSTGLVKQGALEINRTRDYIAQVKGTIPNGKDSYRYAGGIYSGSADPVGGDDGDVYLKIIS